ncbi:transglutaminase-like cysteine peptidase [Brevundimonas goettingensis]|uniref:Transglutaminase-like cysteine peptidase n=1 Tax=Brevundimonas goettingensis TaxID=2774190 RepID=A0A975C3B9_9CAUL|nr:transglutaminase-like cysteine peptidase [Brevundimonas goettingensis]QTC92324.1 transglutaminase-like cysteine peptidase [Brevundimonas goettingensis]
MPLGVAAPAPAGFLDFCRRTPTQCERSAADARDPAAVSRLAASLFWQQAFARSNAAAPSATRPAPTTAGRGTYDWSRVFPAQRAPAPVAPAPVQPTRVAAVEAGAASAADFGSQAVAVEAGAASAADFGSQAVDASADGIAWQAASAAEINRNPMARTFARLGVPAPRIQTSPLVPMPNGAGAASADDLTAPRAPERPAEQAAADRAATVVLDSDNWTLLNRVNRSVNRRIRNLSDQSNYGQLDYWQAPSGSSPRGDCEDYVLTKREELIAAGIPAAALSIAIVETRWGESHAVLLVAGDTGEVVLDNLSAWISRWDRTDYTWHERQAPGSVFEWVNVAA